MGYESGLSIFIDIQGTRDREDFESKLKQHKIFHEEAEKIQLREEHAHFTRRMTRHVRSFSDCAYYIFKWNSNIPDSKKETSHLFQALSTILIPVQILMNNKLWIRGGVALGDLYYDSYGAFGPAIEAACNIENRIAKMPRIVLENTLGATLAEYQNTLDAEQKLIKYDGELYYINNFYEMDSIKFISSECLEWIDFREAVHQYASDILSKDWENEDNNKKLSKTTMHDKANWMLDELKEEELIIAPLLSYLEGHVYEKIVCDRDKHSSLKSIIYFDDKLPSRPEVIRALYINIECVLCGEQGQYPITDSDYKLLKTLAIDLDFIRKNALLKPRKCIWSIENVKIQS